MPEPSTVPLPGNPPGSTDDSTLPPRRATPQPAGEPQPSARYVLGEEIDRGGMGTVYRATDTVLGREVAVKVLRARPGLAPNTRRFADEARIAARLQHPAIPPVHDFGTLPDGRPFLAMKLIQGDTLDEQLKARLNHTADRGRFVAVFEQVCQALAFAHAHDIIHRDLKPSNVMVGSFGEVQVMDWGLAKELRDAGHGTRDDAPEETTDSAPAPPSDRTQTGSLVGTPAFAPPEQAVGAVDRVDARSDVFGLGALLCAILTGQPPYPTATAESARALAARGEVGPAFARLDGCGAEPELVALCKQCLAPDPADRPADAGAVAKAVAGLRAAAEDRARRAELDRARVETRAAEQGKRWLVRVVALLVLLGATLLATGFAYWAGSEFNRASRFEEAAKRAEGADERLEALYRERDEWRRESDIARADTIRSCFFWFARAYAGQEPLPPPAEAYLRALLRNAFSPDQEAPPPAPGQARDETAARLRLAGELHAALGEHGRAADRLRLAKAHYLLLHEGSGNTSEALSALAGVTRQLASALRAGGRPAEAVAEYREALRWARSSADDREVSLAKARAGRPGGANDDVMAPLTRYLSARTVDDEGMLRVRLANALLAAGDRSAAAAEYRAAVAVYEPLLVAPGTPAGFRYNAACVLALASAAWEGAEGEGAAARAVLVLGQLADADYLADPARVAHLDRDPDLDPVRDRPDFRAFRGRIGLTVAPPPRERRP